MSERLLPYGRQTIDEDDIAAVVRVLRSDYLTTGPEVEAFERALAEVCEVRHAIAVSNGTAALHCAYAAAGLGPGDELVTSPLTFSATANMALALGARVVFADVDPRTLCLDPEAARRALGPRTKVIAPVDFTGNVAAMDRFAELGRERGLVVVEDAAHSIGGRYRGRAVGGLAHLTTMSFHPVKTITTAEGGAVLTDDDALAERVRDVRNHGLVRDPRRLGRHDGPWYYEIQSLGFNYRLSDLHAALGRSQLAKLARFTARRRELVRRYREALAGHPRLELVEPTPGAEPAWHLFAVLLDGGNELRREVYAALERHRIRPQVHYVLVSDFPLYRQMGHDPRSTPVAQAAAERILSLPLFPALADEDVDRVVAALGEALA